jgi:hypothetical protein
MLRLRLLMWGAAGLIAVDLCLLTGLIGGRGRWYSPFRPYRLQTEAFLRGSVALSPSPTGIEHDLAWGNGGVQQVWGLGVPVWRLPFEAVARVLGQPAFPDRLALAAAITVAAYIVIRALTASASATVTEWVRGIAESPTRVAAALVLTLFPPVITLSRGPFNVYEEAVAYSYYYTIAMFALSLTFSQSPTFGRYIVISLLGGAAGFLRPTMLSYGVASAVWSFAAARAAGWRFRRAALGPAIFAIGVSALLASNIHRFGAPLEFGHKLTMSAGQLMYLTRFEGPFSDEPLQSAAAELLGSLFFVKELNGFRVFDDGVVAFQSPTLRWRHFYQTTFDVTMLIAVVALWGLAAVSLRRPASTARGEIRGVAVWTGISGCLLSLFYLRFSCMSSRYIVDFAPALAAAIAGLLLASSHVRAGQSARWLLLGLVAVWWTYEVTVAEQAFPPTLVVAQAEAVYGAQPRPVVEPAFPRSYQASEIQIDQLKIHGNCRGWRGPDGVAESLVALFVRDPAMFELEMEPLEPHEPDATFHEIRPRLGNIELSLQSIEPISSGKRLTYSLPDNPAIRTGVQFVCIALAPPEEVVKKSAFKLKSVRWQPERDSAGKYATRATSESR